MTGGRENNANTKSGDGAHREDIWTDDRGDRRGTRTDDKRNRGDTRTNDREIVGYSKTENREGEGKKPCMKFTSRDTNKRPHF